MHRRYRSIAIALFALFAIPLLAGACSSDPPAPVALVSSETEVFDLGAGLAMQLPTGSEVTPIGSEVSQWGREPQECTYRRGAVKLDVGGRSRTLDVRLVGAECEGSETLNGNTGAFLTADQPRRPRNVATTSLDSGLLTTFSHTYTECTNECNDSELTYALLELESPVDPAHPSLLITTSALKLDLASFAGTLTDASG